MTNRAPLTVPGGRRASGWRRRPGPERRAADRHQHWLYTARAGCELGETLAVWSKLILATKIGPDSESLTPGSLAGHSGRVTVSGCTGCQCTVTRAQAGRTTWTVPEWLSNPPEPPWRGNIEGIYSSCSASLRVGKTSASCLQVYIRAY